MREATAHAAGEVASTVTAADVTATESGMTGEPTGVAAASVTTPALRPHWDTQQKRERRDGDQTAHTQIL